jgi:hypothetical protein
MTLRVVDMHRPFKLFLISSFILARHSFHIFLLEGAFTTSVFTHFPFHFFDFF